MQLQHLSLRFIAELSGMEPGTVSRILRVGYRGRALRFAGLLLTARHRSARQARLLLRQVEQAMRASGQTAASPRCSPMAEDAATRLAASAVPESAASKP